MDAATSSREPSFLPWFYAFTLVNIKQSHRFEEFTALLTGNFPH